MSARTGRVLRAVQLPYGSFNLDTAADFVAASSLLRGSLTVYDRRLHLEHTLQIAPQARDVAIAAGP